MDAVTPIAARTTPPVAVQPAAPVQAVFQAWRQHTLKSRIGCVGVAVHSGRRVALTLNPAPAGHGIVFRRTDLSRSIAARFDNVVDTRLSTVIADADWASARVGMIEHLMAAFAAKGNDNALVEVDGPELPILDGSAAPYLFLLDCAGTTEQDAARPIIEITRKVRVTDGQAFAELHPLHDHARPPILELDVTIDFPAAAIGRQSHRLRLTTDRFREEVARGMSLAAKEMQASDLDNSVILFTMWTETLKHVAENGKGNVIFLDGSVDGMERAVKQMMAMQEIHSKKV